MTNIAILGFGVVGGGAADLLTKNARQTSALGGDDINVKYILDLRDFPDSPFADRVVRDFEIIIADKSVSCIIETMGGSHPAYEYTIRALRAGKSVITSNKEVVANFGDELLRVAKEMGVCYRFEASVGGGIPVISPIINCIGQNKVTEIRGILNGTTNYILTKMFTFGDSFEHSLADAQALGYAERNPDADVLGTDASRKIAILAALVTGKLIPTENIHTEGIVDIRSEDVKAAASVGHIIRLLGRAIIEDEGIHIMVAPFLVPTTAALATVSGVYNAVEVIGDPIGNVMFYGPGAGGGTTSSAVIGDLMQIMRTGSSAAQPTFEKHPEAMLPFASFVSQNYIAISGGCENCVREAFGDVQFIDAVGECAFITAKMSEMDADAAIKRLTDKGIKILSRIRVL